MNEKEFLEELKDQSRIIIERGNAFADSMEAMARLQDEMRKKFAIDKMQKLVEEDSESIKIQEKMDKLNERLDKLN